MRKQFATAAQARRLLGALLWIVVFLSAHLQSFSAGAQDATAPAYLGDVNAFTERAAQLYAQALPGMKVEVKGPLALSISGGRGQRETNAYLDSIYAFCLRNPQDCERGLASHIGKMAASFDAVAEPPARANLRAVVRPTAYVQAYEKAYKAQGGPVAKPLIGDLWVMCALDLPTAIQVLSQSQLSELKLSKDEALTACKDNVAAILSPLAPYRRDFPWAGVNVVTGDPYEASWLIFPERWTAIAESMQGDLLVAAPGVNALIYGSGTEADSVSALAKAAAFVAARLQKPLSIEVFRWTPTGWEETKP